VQRSFPAFAALAALLWAAPAGAQSNYRLAPVGGRSQLLGGTGLTFGRDAAAAFLNPATAVLADDQRLSFSVNFYTMSFVYAPRWYVPGPVDRSRFGELRIDDSTMTDLEFNALPSSLCLFFRGADVMRKTERDPRTREARIGFCFASVQNQEFNFAAEGFNETASPSVTRQAQTLSQSFNRFAAGPTYALHVTNYLALGGSLHASLASHRSLLAASATTYGSSPAPITSMFYAGSRGDALQVEATVGATLRYGKQTLGISVKSPSIHIFGVGGANRQSHFDGSGSASSQLSAHGSFVSRSPLRVGLGTGIEMPWGNAELDLFYHAPLGASYSANLEGRSVNTSGTTIDDREVTLDLGERARGVVNAAVGVELNVTPALSVLGGVATDFSAVPSGALRGSLFNYYPFQTHRVTGSLGIGSHGPAGELLVGAELSAGWGDRLAVNSYQLPPVIGTTGHGTYQLMLIVAGSTSLRAIKRAVEDVRDVLDDKKSPKKKPEPPSEERQLLPPAPPVRNVDPAR
jgi:hypothetical protein